MKILLAIDNSEHSHVPVEVLLRRDWPQDCQIKVLMAVDNPRSITEAESHVASVCERIRQAIAHATVTSAVIVGDAKEVIIEQSTEDLADLVVMGARGRQGMQKWERVFLGSVSQHVLMYGPCNTLVAQQTNKSASGHIERVLLALDKSFHSKRAFEWLLDFPWAAGTEVKLITVLPPVVDKYTDGFSAIYTDNVYVERAKTKNVLEQYLAECANTIKNRFEGMKVLTELVEGDPSEKILQEAGSWNAGMIMMGSRGHGGMAKFWLGSISQAVVLEAPCPVEVVKAKN